MGLFQLAASVGGIFAGREVLPTPDTVPEMWE
jgi:hypothetical protein